MLFASKEMCDSLTPIPFSTFYSYHVFYSTSQEDRQVLAIKTKLNMVQHRKQVHCVWTITLSLL